MGYVRIALIILLAAVFKFNIAAQSLVGLHPELEWQYLRQTDTASNFHTLIKPWNVAEFHDSTYLSRGFQYYIHPIIHAQLSAGNSFRQSYGAGIHTGFSFRKSLFVDFNYTAYERQFMDYQQAYIDSTGLIPHYDKYLAKSNDWYLYQSLNFTVSWTPLEFVTLRAGKDRNFFGDGYRSLYLSDNADSYPFLQLILDFWHVKYVFMTARMSDYRLDEQFSVRHTKYTSMHTLSWNVTPKINLNLFEVIVWDATDSISHRTFDINYINPVIFFRPVEYSIGSPDNVIIGFGGKFNIWRDIFLYGQFILDEFKLDEIKARNGWWANKYAFQVGVRSFIDRRKTIMLLAEYNQARPFTYSHADPLQNYGHLVDALAHPMGANFGEGLLIAHWQVNPKWSVHAKLSYAVQGLDSLGVANNYGANIYKSYVTRTKDYGNTMFQGVKTTTSYQELKVARMLFPKWNIQAEATISSFLLSANNDRKHQMYFSLGIRTLLYRY